MPGMPREAIEILANRLIGEICDTGSDLHASLSLPELVEARYQKFRGMGSFGLAEQPEAPPERTGLAGRIAASFCAASADRPQTAE